MLISAENAEFEGATCRGRERCGGGGWMFRCGIAFWIGVYRGGAWTKRKWKDRHCVGWDGLKSVLVVTEKKYTRGSGVGGEEGRTSSRDGDVFTGSEYICF